MCGKTRCDSCPGPLLLPDSVPPVVAYQLCQTQWRVGGMGGRIGLDYSGCQIALAAHRERYELPPDSDVWEGLQVIERATMNADAEVAAAERERVKRERTT